MCRGGPLTILVYWRWSFLEAVRVRWLPLAAVPTCRGSCTGVACREEMDRGGGEKGSTT